MSIQKFDLESGQVYKEMICKMRDSVDRRVDATRGNIKSVKNYTSSQGAASLESMSLRSVMMWSSELSSAHLQDIPDQIAIRIWRALEKSDLVSFRVWEAFASAFSEEKLYKFHEITLAAPLQSYARQISPFTSSTGRWLTFLTVNQREYTMKDFTSLSTLQNLALLRFHREGHFPTNLDDRMIWNWTQYISNSGESCLQHLRLIEFIAHPNVTLKSLEHLSVFPVLIQVKLIPCHVAPTLACRVEDFGWQCQRREASGPDDWIQECVEDEVDTVRDARQLGRPLTRSQELKYMSLTTNYARACWLANGAKAVEEACTQPILSLNLGPLSNSDSAWKDYDDQGSVFCREIPSSSNSYIRQASQPPPRNINAKRRLRSPSSRGRMLKAGKQSNLESVIKGFMF